MLSPDATALFDRARTAEHAVELYLAPGATRLTADRLVEILRSEELAGSADRALWNLLFTAGELSVRVDVYRAHELFRAVFAAVSRLAPSSPSTDPRAAALEMSFHFFFARASHPLVPLRAREVLAALGGLLDSDARAAIRAGIHGLGHLLTLAGDHRWGEDARQLLDDYITRRRAVAPDDELCRYAAEARTSPIR